MRAPHAVKIDVIVYQVHRPGQLDDDVTVTSSQVTKYEFIGQVLR